jgi:predicted ATPase/class 3 adenylate cyclase/DNA-binding CsgD family transcriptional regulator
LPAGTVTFLLTDIEGSTRLWASHADAMAQAVPVHYALLSDSVGRHGGVRPVEQGEGDSVVAAFARASDAVAAALEAQLALSAQAWPSGLELRVRIALHTAEAQLRDEGNYFGIALSRCARLRAIANGGQILLSRAAHDLVVDRLPDGVALVDLGTHRLRDLGRPEHVFGLSHPELSVSGAPLRSLNALPNNLPDRLTSFIGRERELEQVAGALSSSRLLTLTGAGGCGKTRLAAQAAADALDRFPGGVWWVDLAPLADPEAIGPAVDEAIGVRPLPGQSSLDAAVMHLAESRALIVLDNCEHLLEESARVAEALLHGCRDLTVLTTSRAPLGIEGETAWRVPSLSLPAELRTEPVEAIAQSDAMRLFIDRALKVRPNFTVSAENAPAIAQICYDLDGIPLAIELAAARVRVLAVEQIAAGLGDRFRLLTGGARSAMPRQQTLRASVDWSHELLSDDEQTLFRRLAVFSGGWTLDAVEEVCSGEGLDRLSILDLLSLLIDKSLVVADDGDPSVRYRLLETVRQYALDRLSDSGERNWLRDRHRDAYLARAEHIGSRLQGAGQSGWLDVLDQEAANLALALDRAVDSDGELALRLCVALTFWWKYRGRFAQADDACVRALDAVSEDSSSLRARVLWARGYLLTYSGRFEEAITAEQAALEMANELEDFSTAARALDVLGTLQKYPDPVGARLVLEQARELARASGDEFCFVDATQNLGSTYLWQVDPAAEQVFEEALETIKRGGFPECAAWHQWGIGVVRQLQGRDEEALAHLRRAIELADAIGEPVSSGIAHIFLAALRVDRGEGAAVLSELGPVLERSITTGAGVAIPGLRGAIGYAQASIGKLEEARESLRVLAQEGVDGGLYGMAWVLTMLARVELALGQLGDAAEHAQTAAEIADGPLGSPLFSVWARRALGGVALEHGELSEAERLAHDALGLANDHQLPPAVPPVLDLLAACAAAADSFEEAARILAASERAREQLGHVRWPAEQATIEVLRERLREALGADALDESLTAGGALSTDEAIGWLRRARGSRKRPAGGWESLTPTELQVVELAAQGLTNPEIGQRMFISRGTVKIHLSHIYAKLGVRNRSELSARASRRGAHPGHEPARPM